MPDEVDQLAKSILTALSGAGMRGLAPEEIAPEIDGVSRSTLNRRLSRLVLEGAIKPSGAGRSRRYVLVTPLTMEAINLYFAAPAQDRPLASFDETLLATTPNVESDRAARLAQLQTMGTKTDQKFLQSFLIDMSFGSSSLEGGTYSDLDTQALIEYGQANPEKPVEDAGLVLNHKDAIKYLWTHRDLTVANICAMQALLTDDHDLAALQESDHFLPAHQRGVPREYEDVNLQRSAYLPPFRPGSGFIATSLDLIVARAVGLDAIQAAFYLMTRIPYLQAFANGNKRTARLAANLPLLSKGLLPISFIDFDRAEYIRGMAAFYELGTTMPMESVFIRGYVKSIIRGSQLPIALRASGIKTEVVAAALTNFVFTGRTPDNPVARAFVKGVRPDIKQENPLGQNVSSKKLRR